jgi:hypothetical protein
MEDKIVGDISDSIAAIRSRMTGLERLLIRLMSDESIAREPMDTEFLRNVLASRCDTEQFHIRVDGEAFVICRAGGTGLTDPDSFLPLPRSVIHCVQQLASLGAPLRIDLEA